MLSGVAPAHFGTRKKIPNVITLTMNSRTIAAKTRRTMEVTTVLWLGWSARRTGPTTRSLHPPPGEVGRATCCGLLLNSHCEEVVEAAEPVVDEHVGRGRRADQHGLRVDARVDHGVLHDQFVDLTPD